MDGFADHASSGALPSYVAYGSSPPARPVVLKRSNAKALLLGLGIPALLCCGVGTVIAAVSANDITPSPVAPVYTTTLRLTAMPAPAPVDSAAPTGLPQPTTASGTAGLIPPAPPRHR
jgi:hypothetical protein